MCAQACAWGIARTGSGSFLTRLANMPVTFAAVPSCVQHSSYAILGLPDLSQHLSYNECAQFLNEADKHASDLGSRAILRIGMRIDMCMAMRIDLRAGMRVDQYTLAQTCCV